MGLDRRSARLARQESSARTIAIVEAALARLAHERTAAREGVARAMARRDELLLVDGADADLARLDAAADGHRLVLERCDAAEPLLLDELAGLADRGATQQLAHIAIGIRRASDRLRQCVARRRRERWPLINLDDEARRAGFEAETQASLHPADANGLARGARSIRNRDRTRARDGQARRRPLRSRRAEAGRRGAEAGSEAQARAGGGRAEAAAAETAVRSAARRGRQREDRRRQSRGYRLRDALSARWRESRASRRRRPRDRRSGHAEFEGAL